MHTELADVIRPGTSRGLDFVLLDELRKRTGIQTHEVFRWSLNEMMSNSLDTDSTEIHIEVKTVEAFDEFTVKDNGTKMINLEDLKLILDFSNKASSKRGLLRVSRGYLGNALKCIFGYSYALASARDLTPPKIVVNSHGTEYNITLKPDRVNEIIKSEIEVKETSDVEFNVFTVRFPINRESTVRYSREPDIDNLPALEANMLYDLVFATSMVNPSRKIEYDLWGLFKGSLGEAKEATILRQDTSVLWYEPKQFVELFYDYIRARPETQVKEFIALFRGFSSKKLRREILQELTITANHDSQDERGVQFFPATLIENLSKGDIEGLYYAMRKRAKPVSKRSTSKVLGFVGEEQFEKVRRQHRWKRLRYTIIKDRKETKVSRIEDPSFPFLIEFAVFDREENDKEGLEVYQCVNFMASKDNVFSKVFDIGLRLGRVGISEDDPVTVLIHLVCPVLKWLNYAKTGIGSYYYIEEVMKKAFDKILPIPKKPKEYRLPKPRKPVSWLPSDNITNPKNVERLRVFAQEIKTIESQRKRRMKFSSRGWSYILEGLRKIHKGKFNKSEKAINACRKLGFLPIDFVAEDQDTTRRFAGIHEASDPKVSLIKLREQVDCTLENLPIHTTDYWEDEKYYIMMCVEKGDIRNLFKPICDEYHVPIVSSKGWPPILLRGHIARLSQKAEEKELRPVLLLFYDHDPTGMKIAKTFRKMLNDVEGGTGWNPHNLVIDRFGINKEAIEKYGLTWIENLKTGSGGESRDLRYINKYGRRKCESNALFRNEETLEAGEELCRKAIEKYYGADALERFRSKEIKSKTKLKDVYEDPIWENLKKTIKDLINKLAEEKQEAIDFPVHGIEEEVKVEIFHRSTDDKFYYGICPRCDTKFNYDKTLIGRLVRCRECNAPLRLISARAKR